MGGVLRMENLLCLTPCRCTVSFRSLDFSNQIERAGDTDEVVPPGKRSRPGKGFSRIFNDFEMAAVTRFNGQYQIARRCRPSLFRTRQYQHIRERENPFQHPGVVLVVKSPKYNNQPPVRKIREQGFPQRRNPRGIMGAIHHHTGITGNKLQPSLPPGIAQSFHYGCVAYGHTLFR